MPVTGRQNPNTTQLYQRAQYRKGGIGRAYWDFRDRAIFQAIPGTVRAILDAGCGEGITLEKLVSLFPESRITGIDLLEENIDICRKHGLSASKGDLARLELPDASVDCCILSEVIEHLENYRDVLRELWRVIDTDGRLIVVFPNDAVFKIARLITLKFKEAAYDPGHVKQWSPTSMARALEEVGFHALQIKSIPIPFWPLSLHGIAVATKRR
jgi:ubiquinone/menaquinone biosynthesis C-methylase UbiE